MKFNRETVIRMLVDPTANRRVVGVTTYAILAVVAFVMTVMNIVTQKGGLTVATGVFSLLCVLDFVLALRGVERAVTVAAGIFAVELYALFCFFLISGNPEGFSAIWICMAPPIGMLFYDLKRGTAFCCSVFAGLVFFLWTPVGRAFLPAGIYTDSFLARFPLLYLAFFVLAFFLQFLRNLTWEQLDRSNRILAQQATHDQLTGLYNRQGLFKTVAKHLDENPHDSFGVVIFDIDHFKNVNDTYGHDAGDVVLVRFGEILESTLRADVGRWGGEEFAAFFYDDDVTPADVNAVLKKVENEAFRCKDRTIRLTCSAGVSEMPYADFDDVRLLIQKADGALYVSKDSGRNCVNYARAERSPKPTDAGKEEGA